MDVHIRSLMMASLMMMMMMMMMIFAYADEGTATFYDPPYTPSACFGNQDNGKMIAGASDGIWENRGACGRNYKVKCSGAANTEPHPCQGTNTITVKIVDYCTACNGTINLSRDAFSMIAKLQAGKIKIHFDRA
ncbi:EG45-like domain containing protein [Cornus florida]|uniref:EG45-like domain containing protein n=1 Tax=Cornus florida TaxID=4283 RepID=UPI00289F5233|nr:EG45-like domain containing protein [Cornus florida]